MIFQSFNWLFFFLVTSFHWLLPDRLKLALFYCSGIFFVYSYSPLSLAILVPVSLLIIGPYLIIDAARYLYIKILLWLTLWFLYYIYIDTEPFHEHEYFTYEILVLSGYNLARFYHVLKDLDFLRSRGPHWDQILAYLFFPPILFCGPLERIQDFIRFHKNKISFRAIDFQGAFKLFGVALFQGAIAELCAEALTPAMTDWSKITGFALFFYILGIGWEIHFRLSSYINLTRGFAWLMGFNFQKPNFESPYAAKSVAGFWSRWNMSLSRWTRKYLFYGNLEDFNVKRFSIVLSLYFCFTGILHGLNWYYFVWGLLMGSSILLNFAYMFARYHWEWLMRLDHRFFPIWIKRFLTFFWIHFSCIFLVPECELLLSAIRVNIGLSY